MTLPTLTSRKTVREAFANKLKADYSSLVGVDETGAIAIYPYQKGVFKGISPVVCIISLGSEREPNQAEFLPAEGNVRCAAHVFVRYHDTKSTPPITEQDSEDTIDALEVAVSTEVTMWTDRTSENEPEWLHVWLEGKTRITQAMIEGIEYRHEEIPLLFEVANQS